MIDMLLCLLGLMLKPFDCWLLFSNNGFHIIEKFCKLFHLF